MDFNFVLVLFNSSGKFFFTLNFFPKRSCLAGIISSLVHYYVIIFICNCEEIKQLISFGDVIRFGQSTGQSSSSPHLIRRKCHRKPKTSQMEKVHIHTVMLGVVVYLPGFLSEFYLLLTRLSSLFCLAVLCVSLCHSAASPTPLCLSALSLSLWIWVSVSRQTANLRYLHHGNILYVRRLFFMCIYVNLFQSSVMSLQLWNCIHGITQTCSVIFQIN